MKFWQQWALDIGGLLGSRPGQDGVFFADSVSALCFDGVRESRLLLKQLLYNLLCVFSGLFFICFFDSHDLNVVSTGMIFNIVMFVLQLFYFTIHIVAEYIYLTVDGTDFNVHCLHFFGNIIIFVTCKSY